MRRAIHGLGVYIKWILWEIDLNGKPIRKWQIEDADPKTGTVEAIEIKLKGRRWLG